MQLLYYQAPISCIMLLPIIFIFESPIGLITHPWSTHDIIIVFISGFVAFLINLSIFWIIGNTSAISYNVLGQLKLSLTLLGGYMMFQDPVIPTQLCGMLTTLIGCLLYTYVKVNHNQDWFHFCFKFKSLFKSCCQNLDFTQK